MASYELKTFRKPTYIRSRDLRDFNDLAYVTEYTTSSPPDTESLNENIDSSIEREMLKIKELRNLLHEHHLPTILKKKAEKKTKRASRVERTILFAIKWMTSRLSKKDKQLQKNVEEKTEKEEGYINHMPDEIIMLLLRYVSGMDRVNLGSTCYRFRGLLLNSGLLWTNRRITITWGPESDQYATLARQIGTLVICLPLTRDLDDFCLDLFSKEKSQTTVIHVIHGKSIRMRKPFLCWIRSRNGYKKYEIYPSWKPMKFFQARYTTFPLTTSELDSFSPNDFWQMF